MCNVHFLFIKYGRKSDLAMGEGLAMLYEIREISFIHYCVTAIGECIPKERDEWLMGTLSSGYFYKDKLLKLFSKF